jgi:hypothetical protein
MIEQKTNQEENIKNKSEEEQEKENKKIDLNKLFQKRMKIQRPQMKQKYAFTRVGKTKIG